MLIELHDICVSAVPTWCTAHVHGRYQGRASASEKGRRREQVTEERATREVTTNKNKFMSFEYGLKTVFHYTTTSEPLFFGFLPNNTRNTLYWVNFIYLNALILFNTSSFRCFIWLSVIIPLQFTRKLVLWYTVKSTVTAFIPINI